MRPSITARYSVHNFQYAEEILRTGHSAEFQEIEDALDALQIPISWVHAKGGGKSQIPKEVEKLLVPKGWNEVKMEGSGSAKITTYYPRGTKSRRPTSTNTVAVPSFAGSRKIDFVKAKVAFDVEWNSKDQTFDRDLFAFRAFHDAGVIDVAVVLTRDDSLTPYFRGLGIKKFGAASTFMKELVQRLEERRNGGCPVLAIAITPAVIY